MTSHDVDIRPRPAPPSTGLATLDAEFEALGIAFSRDVDLKDIRKRMRSILSLGSKERLPATTKDVVLFSAIHQLMTRKAGTSHWANSLQVELPLKQLHDASLPRNAKLWAFNSEAGELQAAKSAANKGRRASGSWEPLELNRLREEFFRMLGLCVHAVRGREDPPLLTDPRFEMVGEADQAEFAIEVVKTRFHQIRLSGCGWQVDPSPDSQGFASAKKQIAEDEAVQAALFAQWAQSRNSLPMEGPVAHEAILSEDTIFELLRVHARVNQHILEIQAFDTRVRTFESVQRAYLTFLKTHYGDTFEEVVDTRIREACLEKKPAQALVTVVEWILSPLFTAPSNLKRPTPELWVKVRAQGREILKSGSLSDYVADSNFNSFIAPENTHWRTPLLIVSLLAWCHLHEVHMPNDDQKIKRKTVRVMSNRWAVTGPVSRGPNMTSLRRLMHTVLMTGFPYDLSPEWVSLRVGKRLRQSTEMQRALIGTFKGKTILEMSHQLSATADFLTGGNSQTKIRLVQHNPEVIS